MSEESKTELNEDLVAYLDGELDEQVSQEIELTLAQSANARREAEALTRTWELLDVLPEVKATEDFTQKTISTIRLEANSQPMPRVSWVRRARQGTQVALWVTGLVLCSAFGFLLTSQWISHESDELLDELPFIENLHVYSEVDDVEFLRVLQESKLFDEKVSE